MVRVQAWERLTDPRWSGGLDADGLYRLCLQAGIREDEANEIALQRANDRLNYGEVM